MRPPDAAAIHRAMIHRSVCSSVSGSILLGQHASHLSARQSGHLVEQPSFSGAVRARVGRRLRAPAAPSGRCAGGERRALTECGPLAVRRLAAALPAVLGDGPRAVLPPLLSGADIQLDAHR